MCLTGMRWTVCTIASLKILMRFWAPSHDAHLRESMPSAEAANEGC